MKKSVRGSRKDAEAALTATDRSRVGKLVYSTRSAGMIDPSNVRQRWHKTR